MKGYTERYNYRINISFVLVCVIFFPKKDKHKNRAVFNKTDQLNDIRVHSFCYKSLMCGPAK